MKYYEDEEMEPKRTEQQEFGCGFCWDKRKQTDKELFFLDAANNMRICNFCPHCGRAYK